MSTESSQMSFWKTAFAYGFLAGLLIITMMLASFTFFGFDSSASAMTVGFILMFLIMSLIFFGMKKYRDKGLGGQISFRKALGLGAAMALFAALAYVLVWEIYVGFTGDSFIVAYTDHLIEMQKEQGLAGDALAAFVQDQKDMVGKYAHRSFRMPMTFLENFPVGLIVALVSALVLHRPKFWAKG